MPYWWSRTRSCTDCSIAIPASRSSRMTVAALSHAVSVSPVVMGFAIASGALFAVQVNSNFFWMFQTMLGVSTRGALKALTFVTALASVIALPLITGLSFVV